MTSHEYVEAMARARSMQDPSARRQAWRAAKTARQLYLNRKRRERDPAWWADKLAKDAAVRRERYNADPDYRTRRKARSAGARV